MEGALDAPASSARAPGLAVSLPCLLFSGVVQAAISPPLGWVVLHPLSWVPALWVISRLSGRRAFWAGWLVGASANATIFYWLIHTVRTFSNLPTAAGVAILALFAAFFGFYCALFAWGAGAVRRVSGRWWPFGWAAWFAACEFANPQLFPYYQGVAWYQLPSVFLIVSLTGVSAVTFLVIACNGIALQAIESSRDRRGLRAAGINAAVLVALLLGCFGWSAHRLDRIERAEAQAPTLRAAIVQPNYTVEGHRELKSRGPQAIPEDLVALSRKAMAEHGPIDVFLWPERVLVRSPRHRHNRAVREFAAEAGAEIWAGGDYRQRSDDGVIDFYNSAYRVDAAGRLDRRYDKMFLLPFGEYMPFVEVFPSLGNIRGVGRFSPGQELHVYDAGNARFAFLICYEAIRSEFVGKAVEGGIDLLVNLTFDGWYGDTSEPTEHLMLAAVQSAQYGVPLLRSTTTGISAVIDARGLITHRTGLFARETLVVDVKPVRIPSPYAVWGDWFAWACGLASAALLVTALRTRRG